MNSSPTPNFCKNRLFAEDYICFDVFLGKTKVGEVMFIQQAHNSQTHQKWLATDSKDQPVLKDFPKTRYFDSRSEAAAALITRAQLQKLIP